MEIVNVIYLINLVFEKRVKVRYVCGDAHIQPGRTALCSVSAVLKRFHYSAKQSMLDIELVFLDLVLGVLGVGDSSVVEPAPRDK